MAKQQRPVQWTFAAGELAPELLNRRDTQQWHDGAKSLRNSRLTIGGQPMRRPGSQWLQELGNHTRRVYPYPAPNDRDYLLTFRAGEMHAFFSDNGEDDGTDAGGFIGAPWQFDDLRELSIFHGGNTIFVCHRRFPPQVITRTTLTTWERADISYYVGSGGRIQQPYAKLAPFDMTMKPSGLTGNITLTLSAPGWFTAGHVGSRFRYLKREMLITAVTNATTASATVLESLPETIRLGIVVPTGVIVGLAGWDASRVFRVGDLVTGTVSGAKAKITSIVSNAIIDVVLFDFFQPFFTDDGLVAPLGFAQVTSANELSDPDLAAVVDWDEQLSSEVNGYFRAGTLHRSRLVMGGHSSLPSAVVASSLFDLYDFDVGTAGDAEGIFSTIGDSPGTRIMQMLSLEQLILLTDGGPYYVPETTASPFTPTNMQFAPIAGGLGTDLYPKAFPFDGGVLYVSGSQLVKLKPTGNANSLWVAELKSYLFNHLMRSPDASGFIHNFRNGPESHALFVNSDNTLCVADIVDVEKIARAVPWDTQGSYISVCGISGRLYAIVFREIDGVNVYILERFRQDHSLDAVTETDDLDDATIVDRYAGNGIASHVVAGEGRWYLGEYPIPEEHQPGGPYEVGLWYDRVVELVPPEVEDGGSRSGEKMRILEAIVDVVESCQFEVNGYQFDAYHVGDEMSEPPPLRTGPFARKLFGRMRDPIITIRQGDPLALTLRSVKARVAY